MVQADHPWLAIAPAAPARPSGPHDVLTGPAEPQPGVAVPDAADRLPRRTISRVAPLWWVGAHGGAGETVLSRLVAESQAAEHCWPQHPEMTTNVVLVARTDAAGLRAAQRAAADWASGSVSGVRLLGLMVVADAPGRLPHTLRSLVRLVGGGVPRVWHMPWVECWRLGEPVELASAPVRVRATINDLNRHSVIAY
ncbi:MAG: DUF6668 family protein [Actinomycetota bacterium]